MNRDFPKRPASMSVEAYNAGVKALKHRDRMQQRDGHQAYIFPGASSYPYRPEGVGDATNMAVLQRYPHPPMRVREGAAWCAWLADPTNVEKYVAAFCEANKLIHGAADTPRAARRHLRVVA